MWERVFSFLSSFLVKLSAQTNDILAVMRFSAISEQSWDRRHLPVGKWPDPRKFCKYSVRCEVVHKQQCWLEKHSKALRCARDVIWKEQESATEKMPFYAFPSCAALPPTYMQSDTKPYDSVDVNRADALEHIARIIF